MRVLITGGAGFIGSKLAVRLASDGHHVVVLDALTPQIHPTGAFDPALEAVAECVRGDVRDSAAVARAITGADAVVHLAAETGTGQSMYEIARYTDTNIGGTATLLHHLVNERHDVRRVVLSSSRSVYGEGQYRRADGTVAHPAERTEAQLAAHRWEVEDATTAAPLTPIPTHETALLQPRSIYASHKQSQEQLVTLACEAVGIAPVVLRYQNVYGPGQALTNPYTGVICTFYGLIERGEPILLFEDGLPSRDFVYVDDVVAATAAAVTHPAPPDAIVNVGMGERISVRAVAETLCAVMGRTVPMTVSGKYRVGDIRHCYADITRLTHGLGCPPEVSFAEGTRRFVAWAAGQESLTPQAAARARDEMAVKGLYR